MRAARVAGLVALLLWTCWWAARSWDPSGLSWHYFADAGEAMRDRSWLHVYADSPTLQVGPLALLAAAGLGVWGDLTGLRVAQVLMAAAGPLLLVAMWPLAAGSRRWVRVALAGLLLVPAWTVLAVRWAHLDDVLAMSAAVGAVIAVSRGRATLAVAALGAAIAAKPWALGFVPLLMAADRRPWSRMITAVGLGLAPWLPFLIADRGTLESLQPDVPLIPGSGLHTWGVRGRFVPAWGRSVQLLGVCLAGLVAALRDRWAGVLLAAFAVRVALDPQDNPYYVGSAALAAVVYDVVGRRGTVPWATAVTCLALWQPFTADYEHRLSTTSGLAHWWFAHPGTVGWIHVGWAAAMVALVLLGPPTPQPGAEADLG